MFGVHTYLIIDFWIGAPDRADKRANDQVNQDVLVSNFWANAENEIQRYRRHQGDVQQKLCGENNKTTLKIDIGLH